MQHRLHCFFAQEGTFSHLSVQKNVLTHTYTNTCWNRGQGNPEGNPWEDNQQAGGDVSLEDEVQNAPLQLKVEDQLWVIAFEKRDTSLSMYSTVLDNRKDVVWISNPTHKGSNFSDCCVLYSPESNINRWIEGYCYQFHKRPLRQMCSGPLLCTEPAVGCLNRWRTHFLWSSRTWHHWCCNPL